MSITIPDLISKVTKWGKWGSLFIVPSYILLRIVLSKSAEYQHVSQRLPSVIVFAYVLAAVLGGISLVLWTLTLTPLYKSIRMMKAEGRKVSWNLLVLVLLLGPGGAWFSALWLTRITPDCNHPPNLGSRQQDIDSVGWRWPRARLASFGGPPEEPGHKAAEQ
jgi:hypothetical protein